MSIQLKNELAKVAKAGCLVLLICGLGGCFNGDGEKASAKSSASSSSSRSSGSSGAGALTVAPNSPYLRYIGRVAVTEEEALYDWAGTQIEFRVEASRLDLLIEDGQNDYNVYVNGKLDKVISTVPGSAAYPISLGDGEHHLLVTKRTGPSFGAGRFLGLTLAEGGRMLSLPPKAPRKIEFIGDSYTVGYGNEGPGLDCGGVYRPHENSHNSFASIAARALNAESHLVAISGHGAVRNYGDTNTTSAMPMPFYYSRTLMERADLPWNFRSWVPDAVVIKLGANDHSTQPEPPESVFLQGVHDLVAEVNAAYGQLPIFLVADTSRSQVVTRMKVAAAQQQNRGNAQVHFVQVTHPPQSQLGCDYHPLTVAHQSMAEELVDTLKPVMGWQDTQANSVSVTPFKGGAKGAYSIILDDYCASWTSGIDQYAIPMLLERGLTAGLGAIGSECQSNNYQAKLRNAAAQGFEIVNHTWSHPSLVPCDSAPDPNQVCSEVRPDFSEEIDKARAYLEEASGAAVNFFIFPFNSVDDAALNHLREQKYLGARGGTYSINPADFRDPLKLNLQSYQQDLNSYPDQAVTTGSFALRNLHGIADASYEPVPLDQWQAHLDHIKMLSDKYDLWVANPTEIVKYSRARALCGSPSITDNVLTFVGASPGCTDYATGLTVSVSLGSGTAEFSAVQNGAPLPIRVVSANTILIENVDPRFEAQLNHI